MMLWFQRFRQSVFIFLMAYRLISLKHTPINKFERFKHKCKNLVLILPKPFSGRSTDIVLALPAYYFLLFWIYSLLCWSFQFVLWIFFSFLQQGDLDITELDFNTPLFGPTTSLKTTSNLPLADYQNDESYKYSPPDRSRVKQEEHHASDESESNNSRFVLQEIDETNNA